MRAALCVEHGPPEVVRVEEQPSPQPGVGEVGVRVAAAAVNFPDVLLVAGTYQIPVPPPFVPGSEFAGVVTAVGEGVTTCSVGDRVAGTMMVGAFAEEVVASTRSLRLVPESLDLRTAAAAGVAQTTAYHVLRSVARLQAGEELVVLGAGGGVGLAAVRIGTVLGASVTAVASSAEKLEVAAAHGATHLINHRAGDLRHALREHLPAGSAVVIDPVGGAHSEPALRSLRWGGRFVTVGYAAGEIPRIPLNLVLLKGASIHGFQLRDFAEHAPDELVRNQAELEVLQATGQIRPHIGATFPLAEVAAALRRVADGKAIGKVVIDLEG